MKPVFYHRTFPSYRTKLVFSIFSVSFLMLVVFIVNRVVLTSRLIYERDNYSIETLGQFLADEVSNDLEGVNIVHLYQVFDLALKQPNVTLASVLDSKGRVIYSTASDLEHQRNPHRDTGLVQFLRSGTAFRTFPLDPTILTGDAVQIGYSTDQSRRELRRALYQDIILGSCVLGAILLVAWVISGALLTPLHAMKQVASRIAGGDFDTRVHVVSRDIIGALADTLNTMAEQLGDLTANMNRRIERATDDLALANRSLQKKTLALEESNRQLRELDQLKSDFVSMVSHELRTPLTSIIGFSRTLLNLPLTAEQRATYLAIIESEGKRLAELVEDYLNISKIEAGHFALRLDIVRLQDLAREVLASLNPVLASRIDSRVPPELPEVEADAAHLKRVILNLLDNALKYTAPGTRVVLAAESTSDGIEVGVADRGPGLPEEEYAKVFGKFYRAKDKTDKRTRGSGLGLAISKGIVEAHNGRIWVQSRVGEGSTFFFFIPWRQPKTGAPNHGLE